MYDFHLKIMFEFYNLQILYLRTATTYLQISFFAYVTFNDSVSLYTVIVSNFCHHYRHPALVNVAEIYWIQGLSYFCKRNELLLQLISCVICHVHVTFIIWCVLLYYAAVTIKEYCFLFSITEIWNKLLPASCVSFCKHKLSLCGSDNTLLQSVEWYLHVPGVS